MHSICSGILVTSINLSALGRRAGLAVAAAALLSACVEADSTDGAPPASDEAVAAFAEPPQLTAEQLAALRAEVTIASLPVLQAGRVEIVDASTLDGAAFSYIVTGGQSVTDVMRQLLTDQRASPAEVFLALAEPGAEVPAPLLADHRARAELDPEASPQPRQLAYAMPRVIERDNNGCLAAGAEPQSFSSWIADWKDRFKYSYFTLGQETSARNTSDGTTEYYVASDSQGRVMSACNAAWNDMNVVYWALTNIPGDFYPFTLLGVANLDAFNEVHLYSTGNGPMHRMSIVHASPDPDTYVAYGRCYWGC